MKKKMILNSLVSFLSQIIIIILGMVVPRIVMINYGSDTNGLTNTVTQIFTYMALLEAGIGQATQNALYKHVVGDDKKNISRVMSIARRYYRKISLVYAILVVLISLVIPFIIKTDVPKTTVSIYIIFEGLTSLIAFYFTSLWIVFLNVNGKSYVTNLIALFNKILLYAVKIVLSLYGVNIAFIQVGYFAVSLIQLCIFSWYMKKNYFWIDYHSADKNEKLPDRNSYVVTEVAWTIFSSTDMIILSIFVSTAMSSVYSTYSMIFVALETLLNGIYNSIKYLLGHTYHNNRPDYERVHDIFNSVFIGSSVILLSVCYWLIIPFIKMYTTGVNDVDYIWLWLPLGFCLIKLLSRSRTVAGNLSGISGYARQVSYISLLEAATNIMLSLVLVGKYGIYGVILATVIALPIKVIYVNCLADIKIMKRSPIKTIIIILSNYFIFLMTVLLQYKKPLEINSYLQFVLSGMILLALYVVVVTINILVNRYFRNYIKNQITKMVKK